MTSTTSAIASLDSIIAPSTDCSASTACGGVRSNSPPLAGAGPRAPSTKVMRRHPPSVIVRLFYPTVLPDGPDKACARDGVEHVRRAGRASANRPVEEGVGNLWESPVRL